MQITIIQAEIETAIQNHILSQINVKEGMAVNVKLQATRGAEGYTAVIDITPDRSYRAPAPVVAQTVAPVAAVVQAPQVQAPVAPAPVAAPVVPAPVAPPVAAILAAPVIPARVPSFIRPAAPVAPLVVEPEEDAEDASEEVAEEAPAPVVTESVVPPAPKAHSLFKSLKKPVN